MKFSIITPSYNQAQYIRTTLDSILIHQNTCDIEHIVIDGASTDGTIKILEEYSGKHPNLRWISEPDHGQSDALNKGFSMATGDIVAYLNSDDYYLPNVLSDVEKIFRDNPKVDFVYGDLLIVDSNGDITRRFKSLRSSVWKMIFSCPIPQPACFWRSELSRKLPPFNVRNKTCMDAEYFAHAFSQHCLTFRTSNPLACFRIHDKSITGSQRLGQLFGEDQARLEQEFLPTSKEMRSLHIFAGRIAKQIGLILRPDFEIFTL